MRLDSFAKFLAPGYRLGWVTAHPTFVDKLTWHMHGTALGPCSTTQVVLGFVPLHFKFHNIILSLLSETLQPQDMGWGQRISVLTSPDVQTPLEL